MKSTHVYIMICLSLLLTFCTSTPPTETQTPPTEPPTPLPQAPTEVKKKIANPASVYCVEQGGKLEIRDETGGQVGYCKFPDGSECEEWAFFRKECSPGAQTQQPKSQIANPASVYCEEQGGTLEIRDETGGQVGYCKFTDGSECEEWAFFRKECTSGGTPQVSTTNDAFQPIPADVCDPLGESAKTVLNMEVTSAEAPFLDYISGLPGRGCQIKASGTGVNFPDYTALLSDMKSMLDNAGWKEDNQYAADGPTGSASGYWSGDRLCLLNISWLPSPDVQCGQKPITDCNLTPEQKLYTIILDCAQKIQK